MQDWAVGGTHILAIRYQKSGIARDVVICAQQDYPFRISATFKDTGLCQSCQARAEHICVGAAPVKHAVSSIRAWLQTTFPTAIIVIKNTRLEMLLGYTTKWQLPRRSRES